MLSKKGKKLFYLGVFSAIFCLPFIPESLAKAESIDLTVLGDIVGCSSDPFSIPCSPGISGNFTANISIDTNTSNEVNSTGAPQGFYELADWRFTAVLIDEERDVEGRTVSRNFDPPFGYQNAGSLTFAAPSSGMLFGKNFIAIDLGYTLNDRPFGGRSGNNLSLNWETGDFSFGTIQDINQGEFNPFCSNNGNLTNCVDKSWFLNNLTNGTGLYHLDRENAIKFPGSYGLSNVRVRRSSIPIPEPLSILSSILAFGLGATIRKQYIKQERI